MEPSEILPKDSYLVNYYTEVREYSESGEPIYVVIKEGFDYGDVDSQNEICTLSNCNEDSLLNEFVNAQYVQGPVYSWLDDYLNYAMSDCCYQKNGTRCGKNLTGCSPCFHINETTLRPSAEEFYTYLPWFLNLTSPTERCLLYGSPYLTDVIFSTNETYGNTSVKLISTSRFLVHQDVLKSQRELIEAVKLSYELTDNSNVASYPYSPLYIYFEPYLELESATIMIMLVTLAAVFIATIVFLSNPWTSILVLLTICMIIVDLMGVMRLWNVTLNPISLVNLVMAIGISSQFCVHIAFAFLQVENGSRTERAIVALTDMGTPVICGVSMTKLCGVIAFAFTQSEMFHIYYFIMYLALIILGMAHGVVFLPVLLSLFGTEYGKWTPFTVKKKEFRY